jgi:ATP-dependent DNA helicase RecG
MTEVELKKLISRKEHQTLEFKESTGEKKEICETICAFANSDGGIILVGVKNNGKISKAEITEKSQTDITDLFVNFKPKITSSISFETSPDFDGQNILIIKVEKAKNSNNLQKYDFSQKLPRLVQAQAKIG